MRIVLLNERRGERDAMVRALPPGSFQVEAVADEQAAVAAIVREPPQVIIFSVPAKGGPDVARRLRAADSSGQAYVLAVCEGLPTSKELTALMAAGVHDFVRRPIVDVEFVERARAPGRLIRWAQSVVKPGVFDFSGTLDVSRLRAWQNLGPLVAEDLSRIAGRTFVASAGWPKRFANTVHSATIPMSLAGDGIEVRVSVAVDSLTLRWLRESVLGDAAANDEATDDALREFANTAGGAIKRAVLCENVTLTTGLPINDKSATFPGNHQCWTLSLDDEDVCIAVVGEIRSRENQRVPASKLCEGMVLVHDLRNEGGVLLVPAGSRLTSTTAAKLAQMLGPRTFIDVAAVA